MRRNGNEVQRATVDCLCEFFSKQPNLKNIRTRQFQYHPKEMQWFPLKPE